MTDNRKKIKLYVSVASLTFFLAVIVLREFTLYRHAFLFDGEMSDLLRMNYPTYCNLYDNIANGWSFWSWNMGIGTSALTHADVIFDPFTYIMFILGKEHIGDLMVWSLVAKLVCEALSVSLLLSYFKFDDRAILFASVAYAFSGYSLIMGSNLALGTIMVYFPLILLGIEKFIKEKKILVLIISILLTCMLSYYFFYVSGILAFLYMTGRSIYQKRQLNVLLIQTLTLAVLAILVIGMSSFAILPQLELVINSVRTIVSDVNGVGDLLRIQPAVLLTAVLRLFGNNILGNKVVGDYFGSPDDYFQITTYTSACCVILVSQAWELMTDKQKHLIKGTLGAVSVAFLFPLFSFVVNAFSTINYRWIYFVNILLTIGIAFCFDLLLKKKNLNKKLMLKGVSVTYILIFGGMVIRSIMIYDDDYFLTLKQIFLAGRNTLFIFSCEVILLLIFFKNTQNIMQPKQVIAVSVIILTFEIVCNYFSWFNTEDEIYNYDNLYDEYMDGSAYIVKDIQNSDDSLFYRLNKNFDSVYDNRGIPSENDAMVQSYYGLKSYNSLNNKQYITFLQSLGFYVCFPPAMDTYIENGIMPDEITGQDLNYIDGVGDTYDILGYLGVKYHLSHGKLYDVPDYFKLLEQYSSKDIKVYENELYYPLAFINENEIEYDSFMALSDAQKRKVLMQNTVVYDNQKKDTIYDSSGLYKSIKEKQNAFRLISFSNDEIVLEIKNVIGKAHVSFLIPYDKDWNIYIDGKKANTEKINISLLGAEIESGTHVIKLVYSPAMFYLGIKISVFVSTITLLTAVVCYWKKYSILNLISMLEEKTNKLRFPNIPKKAQTQKKNREHVSGLIVAFICQLAELDVTKQIDQLIRVKWTRYKCNQKRVFKVQYLFLVSSQFLILLYVIYTNKLLYATNDDTTMIAIASGGYVIPSQYIINMHVIVGYFLKWLFELLPGINWFTFFYLFVYVISFVCLDMIFTQKTADNQLQYLGATIVLDICFILLIRHFTFTVVAYTSAIAGTISLIYAFEKDKRKSRIYIALGILLVILAALVRAEALKTILLMLTLLSIYEFLQRKNGKYIVLEIAIGGIMFLGINSNFVIMNRNPIEKEFLIWGELRSEALDCAMVPYDEEKFVLEDISEEEYNACYNVFYYIKNAVSEDKMKKLIKLNNIGNKYNFNLIRFAKEHFEYINNLNFCNVMYKWIFAILFMINIIFGKRETKNKTLLLGLTTIGIDFLYYFIQRALYRVVMPTYVLASLLLMLFNNYDEELLNKLKQNEVHYKKLYVLSCIFWVAITANVFINDKFAYEKTAYSPERKKVLSYMEENNDKLFFAAEPAVFSIGVCRSVWDYAGRDYNWNLVGDWVIYSVPSNQLMDAYGYSDYENIAKEAIDNENILFLTSNTLGFEKRTNYILDLYERYYGVSVKLQKVDDICTNQINDRTSEKWASYKLISLYIK